MKRKLEPLAVRIGEAASIMGVSERLIRYWEESGLIRGEKVGGVKLYPYGQFKKLLKVDEEENNGVAGEPEWP